MGSPPAKRYSIPGARHHRLSDGLHSVASSLAIWSGEVTDQQQQQQSHQQSISMQNFQLFSNNKSSNRKNLNLNLKLNLNDNNGINTTSTNRSPSLRHFSLTETYFIKKFNNHQSHKNECDRRTSDGSLV